MARLGFAVHPEDKEPPAEVIRLAGLIEQDGGSALAVYREPVGGHWQIFALLPRDKVQPTPYQRDLSKAHAERLLKVVKKIDRFIDPVVAVRSDGAYWTPNGNHRRHVLEKLKTDFVPAIVIPEPEVAFQILALNTEKAHNLKEKSLEVIRMYRGLIEQGEKRDEEEFAFQFEEAYFCTLGLLYERHARFAGGAFSPILRRVDRFLKSPLKPAYETRQKRAGRVEEADARLKEIVDKVKRRGINHPFVKNFVLARCNPLSRARKTLPSFDQARHQDEAVVARHPPVLEVADDNRLVGHPGKALQRDLRRPAAVDHGAGLVLAGVPGDVPLGRAEGVPLDRVHAPQDDADRIALLFARRAVKGEHRPVHHPFGEIAAEISGHPEPGAVELDRSVAPLVDAERVVESAEVPPGLTVLPGGMGVEVALAEHRAGAGLDDRGVHRPGG